MWLLELRSTCFCNQLMVLRKYTMVSYFICEIFQNLIFHSLYQDVPKVFFPIFYTENLVTIQDKYVFPLKIFRSTPAIFSGTAVFLIVLGSACILYVCLSLSKKSSAKKVKNTTLLENGLKSSQIAETEPLKV